MLIPTIGRDWPQPCRAVLTPVNSSSAPRGVGITIMFCSPHPGREKWASWWGVVSAQAGQVFLGHVGWVSPDGIAVCFAGAPGWSATWPACALDSRLQPCPLSIDSAPTAPLCHASLQNLSPQPPSRHASFV